MKLEPNHAFARWLKRQKQRKKTKLLVLARNRRRLLNRAGTWLLELYKDPSDKPNS